MLEALIIFSLLIPLSYFSWLEKKNRIERKNGLRAKYYLKHYQSRQPNKVVMWYRKIPL